MAQVITGHRRIQTGRFTSTIPHRPFWRLIDDTMGLDVIYYSEDQAMLAKSLPNPLKVEAIYLARNREGYQTRIVELADGFYDIEVLEPNGLMAYVVDDQNEMCRCEWDHTTLTDAFEWLAYWQSFRDQKRAPFARPAVEMK